MHTAKLVCVNPKEIDRVLPSVIHLIDSAVNRSGDLTRESVVEDLKAELSLLWLTISGDEILGITITQLRKSPKGLQCWVILVAGHSLKNWSHLIEKIEQFAKDEGCTVLRWEGRPGWGRVFKGYAQPYVAYEKRLK